MVHELLGLNDNRVVLRGAPGVRKDLEEVSLGVVPEDCDTQCSILVNSLRVEHGLQYSGLVII